MFNPKNRKPSSHLLKLLIVAFILVLASISVLSSSKAYAATAKNQPGKTVGAELIVNGKVFKLTPVSSTSVSAPARPHIVQYCAFIIASESNVYSTSSAAYFNYSLRVYNQCSSGVTVTGGHWAAQGSINCNGTWYDNPPSDSGNVPSINAGSSALVRDQVPYEAICIAVNILGIPYEYPPSDIQVVSAANGSLSNKNTWSDDQDDYFNP